MNDIQKVVCQLSLLIKQEEEFEQSLTEVLPDFAGKEKVESYVEEFESTIAFLLLKQRTRYIDILNAFVAADDSDTLNAILSFFKNEVFSYEVLVEELALETSRYLHMTVEEFASVIMQSLDSEVPFNVLSNKSIKWIEEWSVELAKLMNLSTQNSVEKILTDAIKNGSGIDVVERNLMETEAFSRERARKTAITEILTASSVAHQESYEQSPSVIGKQWKHSGNKAITPRVNHMELDGTIVPVNEPFTIPGSEEKAMFPRDPQLSAKERISCHCVQGPVVDEVIFGLSAEEKQALRDEAIAFLNAQ